MLAVLGVLLALGVVGGLLWYWLWEPASFVVVDGTGAMGETELIKQFNADGWYTLIAAGLGLLSGVGLMAWRHRDPLLTVITALFGSALAAVVMVQVGGLLGPGAAQPRIAEAAEGALVSVPLELHATTAYLVWPITWLFGGVLTLWVLPTPADPAEVAETEATAG